MKKTFLLFIILISWQMRLSATILRVPSEFATIQAAIESAQAGDTVLVAPGIYPENIDFHGKGIVVASQFLLTGDTTFINTTVIDGSHPLKPDTASCVTIASNDPLTTQDSTAALIGFRITGGKGTIWEDEHNLGSVYREGGGILIQYLSPRILFNHIVMNDANDKTGCTSAGGGGIRCGDGNPRIENNIIERNTGLYGGGIVLNFSGAVIRNNIISLNTGGNDFGGGGIWMYGQDALSRPRILTNNTIVFNSSVLGGGGIRVWSTTADISNCILWGNTASVGSQIQGTVIPRYCDIQGGSTGVAIIDQDPSFDVNSFYLASGSPCIDSGDPLPEFRDPEDMSNPGNALFPAMDSTRNDMGAYGGPESALMGTISSVMTGTGKEGKGELEWKIFPNPCHDYFYVRIKNTDNDLALDLSDLSGKKLMKLTRPSLINLKDLPSGMYLLTLEEGLLRSSRILVKD